LRLSEKLKKPTNFITDDIVRKTLSKYKWKFYKLVFFILKR
jgi:hypothetical protein